jgi:SAM-dependent methyltransferase
MYDDQFDERAAERELLAYRRDGLGASTERLVAELSAGGVAGLTIIDIGAGIGGVHLALLEAGAAGAVDIDASGPYLAAAQGEAERRGLAERVAYHKGDAVGVLPGLPDADIVALDRVVCCYPDMTGLVAAAAARTRHRLGLVLPRDDAWVRAGATVWNGWNALVRDPFRFYVNRTSDVIEAVHANGLAEVSSTRARFWQVLVFER